jgi:hypothetical protein
MHDVFQNRIPRLALCQRGEQVNKINFDANLFALVSAIVLANKPIASCDKALKGVSY